jgi:hypothetical protein
MQYSNTPRPSTIAWPTVVRIIGWIVAPLWVAPALWYNLDWAHHGAWENVWSAMLVLGAAAALASCHWTKAWWQTLLAVSLGLCLTFNNSWNALETISNDSDRRIDGRKTKIKDAARGSSERSEWSAIVDAAKLKVGVRSVGELKADLDAYLAKNAKRWRETDECDPTEITRSADFCAEVRRLEGLVATAKERDRKAALIRDHDEKNKDKETVTNANPMTATVAKMMATFGVTMSPEGIEGVQAWRNFSKTFSLEALAAGMPLLWILMIEGMISGAKAAQRLAAAAARAARPAPSVPIEAPPPSAPVARAIASARITPEFERFCADELEEGATYDIDAGPAYDLHQRWRRARGLQAISQKKFGGMMGERFTRDPNGGYPRYLGVRARVKAPKLVVSN